MPSSENPRTLLWIAAFKLFKGILLLGVAIGALRFLHRDLGESVLHWVNILRVDPENRLIHRLLARISGIQPKQLREISAGTFLYSALLLTEGTGLLLRKRWAEYFTIISTGALIPLEVYELVKHTTIAKIGVLLVNVAIVWYLVERVVRARRAAAVAAN